MNITPEMAMNRRWEAEMREARGSGSWVRYRVLSVCFLQVFLVLGFASAQSSLSGEWHLKVHRRSGGVLPVLLNVGVDQSGHVAGTWQAEGEDAIEIQGRASVDSLSFSFEKKERKLLMEAQVSGTLQKEMLRGEMQWVRKRDGMELGDPLEFTGTREESK